MYTLLIADDEYWVRQSLATTIDWGRLGFTRVLEAENGEQALKIAMERRPDVVITDIRMPGMNGLELCEQLGRIYPGIQMLLISAYQDFFFAQRAIQLGVRDYILKPIDERQLTESVARCLQQVEHNRAYEYKPERSGVSHRSVRAVLEYIEKNYVQHISLSTAANHVHMNPSYLSKLFCDETGETFTKYLMKVRVERAKRLLEETTMHIYEVGEQVGYGDIKYFVKVFRNVTGQSPSEWRNNATRNQTNA